jgi:4-hydroxy-tetrahydrodipicolinate reductase
MGKIIEKIALERGHEIVLKVDEHTQVFDLSKAELAIDFSVPAAAYKNVTRCFEQQVPVVCGTTGWLDRMEEATAICQQQQGAFIYASNFSLGVNVFFELNAYLARMMQPLSQYAVSMEEIHHTNKLDTPSGTAISLAEGIIEHSNKTGWSLEAGENPSNLPIVSKRLPEVPGTHTVEYTSTVDSLEIRHTAHNREGFALGAVIAAEWLVDKTGIFTMKDVLGLSKTSKL